MGTAFGEEMSRFFVACLVLALEASRQCVEPLNADELFMIKQRCDGISAVSMAVCDSV